MAIQEAHPALAQKNSTGKSDSDNNAQDASSTLYTSSKVYSTIVMSVVVAFFTFYISF